MSAYPAPTEDITEFNTSLFNQPEETLSQAEADKLYLSKTSNDISTASSTTFNGAVSVSGNLTGSNLIQSNTTSATTNKLFDNLFSGSTLAIGTANCNNTISGQTIFNNTLIANLNSNTINGNGNTGTKNFFTALTGTLNVGAATTTLINLRGPSTFDLDTTFSNRLNFSATSYSFPFGNTSLGYYLKATTSPAYTTLPTATPKTILTTASIPIGVWRIDFSVQNLVTGAGTITQAQSFISTTIDGAIATAVPFTGSIIRSHISEVYATNDVQVLTSSFTYQQSTAVPLYLNIVRSFSTGAYSFIGEVAITRIA